MWKNNDLKKLIAKMATISTVATNGASTLLLPHRFHKVFFFEELCFLILASSQSKLRGYIEFLKFDVTIKKLKNSSKI